MVAFLHDNVLDNGLAYIDTNADKLHIGSGAIPTTYAGVTGATLGNKASPAVSAPANGSSTGRSVTVSAITDGAVTGTGTAAWWALVDEGSTLLLAAQSLSASQGVTDGNTFTLGAIEINFPDPTA
jgi:hypothetical protein